MVPISFFCGCDDDDEGEGEGEGVAREGVDRRMMVRIERRDILRPPRGGGGGSVGSVVSG